jgi:1,2-phenylacetyl-CoA epoxidase catalytic subunit
VAGHPIHALSVARFNKREWMAQRDRDTIRQIESAAQGTDTIPASRVKSWLRHAPSADVTRCRLV